MPPLRALRAFEAAARHGSFVKAAEELAVTPGAIAQQVRILENWLGQPLFVRQAHGVVPTSNTQSVGAQLSVAFDLLAGSVQALRAASIPNQVRIAALPSVALLWLSRRLPQIRQRFPELEISVAALDDSPNFKRDLFDIGIFYADGPPPGTKGTPILTEMLFPVCSPSLGIRSISELAAHTLIHDGTWRYDWANWLKFVDASDIPAQRGPVFSLYSLAVQSAVEGEGILMGRRALVQRHLEQGLLIKPFEAEVPTDKLFLLLPDGRDLAKTHLELAEWIVERREL